MRPILAAVMFLAVSCAQKEGPPGPAGPAGPAGTGFDPPPSVSFMSPRWAGVGTTSEITLLGYNTAWTSAATVSFGPGVTVSKVTVASPSSLIATVTVAPTTAAGTRDVTVTEGGKVATYKGFAIKPLAELVITGTQQQGSVLEVTLTINDSSFEFSADPKVNVSASGTSDGGIGLEQLGSTAVTSHTLRALVGVDVDSPTGKHSLTVVANEGTALERQFSFPDFVDVQERVPTDAVSGTPVTGSLSAPGQTLVFKYDFSTLTTSEKIAFSVTGSGTGAAPVLSVMTSERWSSYASFGSSELTTIYSDTVYVVVYDPSGTVGDVTLKVGPVTEVVESEPNNDRTTGTTVSEFPVKLTGSVGAADDDWFKVAVPPSASGKQFYIDVNWPGADWDDIVEVYNGASQIAVFDYYHYSGEYGHVTVPPGATELFVLIHGDMGETGDYEIQVYLQ